jgi:hypothetical protein
VRPKGSHDTKRDTEGEKDLSRRDRPNITTLCELNIPLANVNLGDPSAPVGETLDQKRRRQDDDWDSHGESRQYGQ